MRYTVLTWYITLHSIIKMSQWFKIYIKWNNRRYFFCEYFMFFLSYVCYVFVRVCLYVLCGHLLEKGWSLGSRLWCLTMCLSLSHWYPGSGVLLDCIDSWSLHPYLPIFKVHSRDFSNMMRMREIMTSKDTFLVWYIYIPDIRKISRRV